MIEVFGVTPYVVKQLYSNEPMDKESYSDKFKYDKEQKVYICPAGKEIYYYRAKKSSQKPKIFENCGNVIHGSFFR